MYVAIADRVSNDGLSLHIAQQLETSLQLIYQKAGQQPGISKPEKHQKGMHRYRQWAEDADHKGQVWLMRGWRGNSWPAAPDDFSELISLVHNLKVSTRLGYQAWHDTSVLDLPRYAVLNVMPCSRPADSLYDVQCGILKVDQQAFVVSCKGQVGEQERTI